MTWTPQPDGEIGPTAHENGVNCGFTPAGDSTAVPVAERPENVFRVDPELARLAIAQRVFSLWRVWTFARDTSDGSGWVDRETLFARLAANNVPMSPRNYRHLLAAGEGIFWTLGYGRAPDGGEHVRVYLTGEAKLAARLTRSALDDDRPELVTTNRPGVRKVYIDLSGGLKLAEARCYAAWLGDECTISRDTQAALFGRSHRTLRRWEARLERAGEAITRRENYAQCHPDTTGPDVPDYAYLCKGRDGDTFYGWQRPNTYFSNTETHAHKGNARKVRTASNSVIQPVKKCADGLHRIGRIQFEDKQTARGFVPATKALARHLKQHGDIFDRHHYIWLGESDAGHGIYEASDGQQRTTLDARDLDAERAPAFQLERAKHHYGLSAREK